jgi:Ca2+-binding EF-hand superfamily protein
LRSHFNFEESNELIRKRLSKRPNFSIHEAFATLDQEQNGYIVGSDFRRLLKEAHIYSTD